MLVGEDNTLSKFAFRGPVTTPENTLKTIYKTKYKTNIPAILKDPDKFPYIGAAAKEVTLHADAPDGGEVNRGGSGLKYDSVYVFEGKKDEKSRSFGNIHPPKKEHYVFEGYFEKNTQIFDKDGVLLKVPDGTDVYTGSLSGLFPKQSEYQRAERRTFLSGSFFTKSSGKLLSDYWI